MKKELRLVGHIFLLLFLINNSSIAQVPGYQGKRFFIELGVSGMFNFDMPTIDNLGPNTFPSGVLKGAVTFSSQYSLGVNYIFSRKFVLQMNYGYSPSGLAINGGLILTNTSLINPDNQDVIHAEKYHDLFYQLHSHKIELNGLFYAKPVGNLAPLGWYYLFGMSLVRTIGVLKYQETRYPYLERKSSTSKHFVTRYNSEIYEGRDPRPDDSKIELDPSIWLFGLKGGIGYRTIIADWITLSFQLEVTIYFQDFEVNPEKYLDSYYHYNITKDRIQQYYTEKLIDRIQENNVINFRIGVGVFLE